MMYDWLEKRVLRSVDHLRLWPENPRLDPDEEHIRLADFVSALMEDSSEKKAFIALLKSIARRGFIPADPIVVWQDGENGKYYVAEGNRRVIALKLLRNPFKAPKSIRALVRQEAALLNPEDIEKVRVAIAPSFDECEWYLNQRHATNTLLRPWTRLQQKRWIADLYDKYDRDISKLQAVTNLTKGEMEFTLRILKLRDMAVVHDVLSQLNEKEQESVKSHRIPLSILERWFNNVKVREAWGISFDEDKVIISSNINSFHIAYAAWLKLVIHRSDADIPIKIDTRTIDDELDNILKFLPTVKFTEDDKAENTINEFNIDHQQTETANQGSDEASPVQPIPPVDSSNTKNIIQKNNPNRPNLVISTQKLITSNTKLDGLFNEFKKLPLGRYPNSIAASLRVFLDMAIAEYFKSEACIVDIEQRYNNRKFKDIQLKQRLDFLKTVKLNNNTDAHKVVVKLLNAENNYSLDTLNIYIHGHSTHYTNKEFLNGFWDFLFPLFQVILEMED